MSHGLSTFFSNFSYKSTINNQTLRWEKRTPSSICFALSMLLFFLLLRYPLLLFIPPRFMTFRPTVEFITDPMAGFLVFSTLIFTQCLQKTRLSPFLYFLLTTICASSVIHLFWGTDFWIGELLYWIGFPVLVFLNWRFFAKVIPWFLGGIWLLDVTHAFIWIYMTGVFANKDIANCIAKYLGGLELVSLPSNRNWQAAFLLATTPAACWCFCKIISFYSNHIKQNTHFRYFVYTIISAIVSLVAIFLKFPCYSRASWLSAIVVISFFLIFFSYRLLHKYYQKIELIDNIKLKMRKKRFFLTSLIISFTFFFILIGTTLFLQRNLINEKFDHLCKADIRLHIWEAALRVPVGIYPSVIEDPSVFSFYQNEQQETVAVFPSPKFRWLLGTGPRRYEEILSVSRDENYYMAPNPAQRSDYPHNFSLYIIGSYGIPVGIAITLFLIITFCGTVWRIANKPTIKIKNLILLWPLITLLFHAQLDLIIEQWPNNIIILLLIGFFMRSVWKVRYVNQIHHFQKSSQLIACSIFLGTLIQSSFIFYSTSLDRLGKIANENKKYQEADYYFWKAAQIRPRAENVYGGLINSFYIAPERTIAYQNILYNKCLKKYYCESWKLAGDAWARMGYITNDGDTYIKCVRQADFCFQKQQETFPIALYPQFSKLKIWNDLKNRIQEIQKKMAPLLPPEDLKEIQQLIDEASSHISNANNKIQIIAKIRKLTPKELSFLEKFPREDFLFHHSKFFHRIQENQ